MSSNTSLPLLRSLNQLLAPGRRYSPVEVVRHLGMIQAQDYLGALWAVGVRSDGADEAAVERALAERSIVRTWPARGTLHFVPAEDVRWMLDLLAVRVISGSTRRYDQLELVPSDFSKSRELLIKALQGGRQLTRGDAYEVLDQGGVSPAGQRGIHILGYLAMQGLICLGQRSGKQHTFVLLDEWVPSAPAVSKEEALFRLAVRYITGHGPATVKDFAWWSGLTQAAAKTGLESARGELLQQTIDGIDYWLPRSAEQNQSTLPVTLLPPFDEYLVGYTDRRAVLEMKNSLSINAGGGMLSSVILVRGKVAGTWKRTLKKKNVVIRPAWFTPPSKEDEIGFEEAAAHYAAFLGLQPEISRS